MKKIIVSAIALSLVFTGCNTNKTVSETTVETPVAKGGKSYGGVLMVNENEFFKNLYPHNIVDAISYRVASQMYEGLFTFNQNDLSIEKRLCDSYKVSEDGLKYTFKIKQGVFFHSNECFKDGEGRELIAEDFKFSFTQLCTQDKNNQGFILFKDLLKGANEYYQASLNGTPDFEVEGIKVIDKYTLELSLIKPSAFFITNLATPSGYVFPKEAYEMYGLDMREKVVGTGPFVLQSIEDEINVILKKNNNYHRKDEHGNQLPFLDAIKISFIPDKKSELFTFKKGNLDMIYGLPTEHIINILETTQSENGEYSNYNLQRKPEMGTHFLGFQMNDDVFKNRNVRLALSYAIDRVKILESVLNNEGFAPGNFGITPPIPEFKKNGYDATLIKGYSLNLDSARYYLKKAGFPNGKGFPKTTLDLNSGGLINVDVAQEVKKQLKEHLNIEIDINIVPLAQHIDNFQYGKTNFYHFAWIADIPTAQNFLWMLYGKDVTKNFEKPSYPNTMRYQNDKYDEYYEKALNSLTLEEANQNFLKAEQQAMNDAPIIVLWYDEGYRLLQSRVKDCPNNPMQFRDFGSVYLEKAERLPSN